MKVQLVVRSYKQMIGLSRYTECLCKALSGADIEYTLITPTYPFLVTIAHKLLSPFGFDIKSFFTTYPLAARTKNNCLTHLTAQQMGTLLRLKPRLHPVIITVHDIVPYLVRKDVEQTTFRHPLDIWFDKLAMGGLKRADALISDSHFTKQTVIEALGCPAERIHVVHLGVEHSVFRPQSIPEGFRKLYKLEDQTHHVLYVGSENPRKNLPRLLKAFAQIHKQIPDVRLIKIGSPEYGPQAEKLRHQVQLLGLEDDVVFIDHVSDKDLALFYNFADLFVFPSIYEGFGLPPLEAMACGTPVICSNAASLPEVVGDAAMMVDPYETDGLANAMLSLLSNKDLCEELREKGLARAKEFTWERTARETIAVYEKVLA